MKYYLIRVEWDWLRKISPGMGTWRDFSKYSREYSRKKSEALRIRPCDIEEFVELLVRDGIARWAIETVGVGHTKKPAKIFNWNELK